MADDPTNDGAPELSPAPDLEPDEVLVDDRNLVLDEFAERLDAFNAFRKNDVEAADAILTELGANDRVDRDIVLQLAGRRPIGHPDRFLEAHTIAVRSLEVLDRNGDRSVGFKGLGPLSPIASVLVQLVTRFIVRNHLRTLTDNMHRLYIRREANCLPGDPARFMLLRARRDADRLVPTYRRNPLGVPTFLLGEAVLSTVVTQVQRAVLAAAASTWARIAVVAVLFLILVAASSIVVRGAAAARRRIVLTTEQPFDALYETIGRAGNPPKDQSRAFGLYSVLLLLGGWLIVPIGLFLLAQL